MTEPVGTVTATERDEIKDLYLRRTGLTELFSSLARMDAAMLSSSPLYDRLVRDMGDVSLKFQAWWEKTAAKYGWPGRADKKWRIDFDTCEIYLE